MSRFCHRAVTTGALLALTTACGTQPRIEKLYQDPTAGAVRYEKLLVIGFARDGAGRQMTEDLIVANLADEDVAAIAGQAHLDCSIHLLQQNGFQCRAQAGGRGHCSATAS